MYWYTKPHPIYSYMSEATHVQADEYNKRGRYGRISRVSNARQRLRHGLQWVTKRYNR